MQTTIAGKNISKTYGLFFLFGWLFQFHRFYAGNRIIASVLASFPLIILISLSVFPTVGLTCFFTMFFIAFLDLFYIPFMVSNYNKALRKLDILS